MKERALNFLLTLCMLLTFLPVPTLADELPFADADSEENGTETTISIASNSDNMAENHSLPQMSEYAELMSDNYINADDGEAWAELLSGTAIQEKLLSLLYGNDGGRISCDFDGYSKTGSYASYHHEGIDCVTYEGHPVYAILGGVVTSARIKDGLSTIAVYNAEHNVTIIYLHVKDFAVSAGQNITQGAKIASEGANGATSAHTHVELRTGSQTSASVSKNTVLENPNPYPYYESILGSASQNNTGGGGGNTGGNASVPEPQILLDAAYSPAQGQLYVKGWAYDPDKKDRSLEIHIYAGDAGNYGSHIATVRANRSRPDVNDVFPGVGTNHGFEETLSVSLNGTYSIRAAAIGINSAGNNDGINTFSNHIDASVSQPPQHPETLNVTLNANGGSVSAGNISVRYGETYGALPTPTRSGYAFDGWYTAASGGSLITAGSAAPTADCTLYAHWTLIQGTITARLNGGSYNGSTADFSMTKTVGETVNFLPPERDGYDFVGWRLVSGLTGYQLRPWGTPLIADPTFSSSDAGATTYNGEDNGAVKLSLVGKSADCPTDSGRMLQIKISGNASPGLGGYYQLTHPDYGKTFYHMIVAKIPVGYTINLAHNEAPADTVFEWLTPREGTGNFETYVYRTIWPDSGVMGSFGHVYLTGDAATESNPVTWYVGYSQMFDATGIAYEKNWGTPLVSDPIFSSSDANATTYNGEANGAVKLSIVGKSEDCPTDSDRMLQIKVSGNASPGLGGYYQLTYPEYGKTFYHKIVAKIPVGYAINFAHNQTPVGTTFEWLTPTEGTGNFETYIYRTAWPASGLMGSFGHVYIDGPVATESNPVTWYVGYSQMFDATTILTVGEGNATLTAMWRRKCEITLDANGGSVSPNSVFISQNEPYGTLPTPVRAGYLFDGWYTLKTNGTRVTEGSGSVTANQTLYALWTLDDGSQSLTGSGTETDPYQIFNQQDLLAVKRNLSAHYLLKSDIALIGLWTPIGLNTDFDGVFDGGGHTISNLSIVYSDWTYAGLFGSNAGAIRNLTVIGTVSGGNDASSCAGVLAGRNNFGTILNCSVTGTITVSKNTAAGGLVGYLRGGSASGCASAVAVNVSGYGKIGGLFSVVDNSSNITDCYALGGVQATNATADSVAGGLVGHLAYNSKVTNCYAAGAVTADNGTYGGLIGLNEGIVTASYFDMDASGQISANAGTPLSGALMRNQSVYSDWDFNTIWKMASGINSGYPHLRGVAPAEKKKQSLVSIEIVSKPDKISYEISEVWNGTGLLIQAVYSDNTRETLTDGFEISGFNSSSAGQKTVTVTYQGKTATFNVTVLENAPVDSGAAQIAMENQSVSSGATFTVPVLLKNNPGVIGFSFAVEYDAEKLEYVSAADADFTGIAANVNADDNQLGFAFSSASKTNLFGETIVKLTFRAKSGAEGTANLAFVIDEAFGDGFSAFNSDTQENEPVSVSIKDAEISIADFIPGDVNGSGRVDNEDLILLTRYRARWKVSINMDAADVDGNGKVDNEDLIRLTRYRARWKVTLLPGKVSAA